MESSRLAAYVASRICHDVASPLTSLLQSCELLFDDSMGPAMKAGDKLVFDVEARGQFSNFKSEVLDALRGNEPGGGWGGGAVQPYFTSVLAQEMGFTLEPRIVPQAAALVAIGELPAH
ncbi:MAG: hypothetical protein EON61_06265 [Alphaproteobacteria bacterium]|nr:MAG: hypothetical protein EON61_06265 [Alphaproteobacteria bacterium]